MEFGGEMETPTQNPQDPPQKPPTRAPEIPWRDRFVLEAAQSKVARQAEILDNLRSNAGVLLGAINVGIALLA